MSGASALQVKLPLPFRRHAPPHKFTSSLTALNLFNWTCSFEIPRSLAASPGCGVKTKWPVSILSNKSFRSLRIVIASASKRIGVSLICFDFNTDNRRDFPQSAVPKPGPTTIELAFSKSPQNYRKPKMLKLWVL